jgi:hypothetical protein
MTVRGKNSIPNASRARRAALAIGASASVKRSGARSSVTAWSNVHEADCPTGPSNRKELREHHSWGIGRPDRWVVDQFGVSQVLLNPRRDSAQIETTVASLNDTSTGGLAI